MVLLNEKFCYYLCIFGWFFFFFVNICLCDYILMKVDLCDLCKFIFCFFYLILNYKYFYDMRFLDIWILVVIILFYNK